ncbi:MAG: hypothetical protein WAO16_13705 [Pseudolabrys sp.]
MVKAQRLKELLARYHREVRGVVSAEADAQLQRWQDDKGANEPLKALGEIVSQMEKTARAAGEIIGPDYQIEMAAFLIPEILTAPYDATKEDELSSDLARVRRETGRAEKKLRAKLAKRVRSEPLQNLSAYLKRQGAKLEQVRVADARVAIQHSGKGGQRVRTLAIRHLSRLAHDSTNQWMDKQVAALATLVLGSEIDTETVRNVRRPTSRKARKPQRL